MDIYFSTILILKVYSTLPACTFLSGLYKAVVITRNGGPEIMSGGSYITIGYERPS